MQFRFLKGKGTTDAIFIVIQMPENKALLGKVLDKMAPCGLQGLRK